MYKNIKKICWVFLLIALLVPHKTLAASGTPNSNNFGYGVRVDLEGPDPAAAVQEAGKFNLDWIAIDLNWERLQSDAQIPPAWEELDRLIALATKHNLEVMISITQAPSWAMDQDGPSPYKTRELTTELVTRYSDFLLALEIFPLANTAQGWGTTPNPSAYTRLLKVISQNIGQLSQKILVVGGGLVPLVPSSDGMDDLIFLREVYAEGIAEYMPLLGLRLPPLGSEPLTQLSPGNITLRHYENIRSIMSENGHKNGLIWITGFSWDAETINSPDEQAAWMKQAYLLFRSQLYIGAAFFDGLNSAQGKTPSLLLKGGVYHPGFEELIQVIALDHDQQTIIISSELSKRLTNKNYPKANTL